MTPLVLRVSRGGGNRLPSGDQLLVCLYTITKSILSKLEGNIVNIVVLQNRIEVNFCKIV